MARVASVADSGAHVVQHIPPAGTAREHRQRRSFGNFTWGQGRAGGGFALSFGSGEEDIGSVVEHNPSGRRPWRRLGSWWVPTDRRARSPPFDGPPPKLSGAALSCAFSRPTRVRPGPTRTIPR